MLHPANTNIFLCTGLPPMSPRVKASCHLSYSEGEKPRSALYTCSCGGQFDGLKAWRQHMVDRSMLRKREHLRQYPSTCPPCILSPTNSLTRSPHACAVPERITLPGVSKKRKGGRGSPMEVDDEPFTSGDLDTVYINLNKRVDRKKLIQAEMRAQGLKGRRFPARMGDEVKDSVVARQWHSKLNCLYDKKTLPALHNMSKGERGCSGSHHALWKQCAKRTECKPMLILEDDAVLWERSGVSFTELTHRLIAAVEQVGSPPPHHRTRMHGAEAALTEGVAIVAAEAPSDRAA